MNIFDLFVLIRVYFLRLIYLFFRVNVIFYCCFILRVNVYLFKGYVDDWNLVIDEENVYKCICVWVYVLVRWGF